MKKILFVIRAQGNKLSLVNHITEKAKHVVCGYTENGYHAVFQITKLEPDVVVLGPHLVGLSQIDIFNYILENKLESKVIFLEPHDQESLNQYFRNNGAVVLPRMAIDTLGELIVDIVNAHLLTETSDDKSWDYMNEDIRPVDLTNMIAEVLKEIGMPVGIKGNKYLIHAIELVIRDREYLENIMKSLYPVIANKENVSSSSVERAIRHAISITWERDDLVGKLNSLFRHHTQRISEKATKPTNLTFIRIMSGYIHNRLGGRKIYENNSNRDL